MAISRLLRPTHRSLRGLGVYGRSITDGGAAPAGSKGGAAKEESAPASAGSGTSFSGKVLQGNFHVTPEGGLYLTVNVVKDAEVVPSSFDQNEDGKMVSGVSSVSKQSEKAFSEPVKKVVEKAVEKTVDTAVSKTVDWMLNMVGNTFSTSNIGRIFQMTYWGAKKVAEKFRKKDQGDKGIEKGKEGGEGKGN